LDKNTEHLCGPVKKLRFWLGGKGGSQSFHVATTKKLWEKGSRRVTWVKRDVNAGKWHRGGRSHAAKSKPGDTKKKREPRLKTEQTEGERTSVKTQRTENIAQNQSKRRPKGENWRFIGKKRVTEIIQERGRVQKAVVETGK